MAMPYGVFENNKNNISNFELSTELYMRVSINWKGGSCVCVVIRLPSCRFILHASGVEVAMCLDNWGKELLICWKTACGEGVPCIVGGARSAVQSGHPLLLLC